MSEFIRLYMDEDTTSRSLIRSLRSRSVDLVTVQEAGLRTESDETHLKFAQKNNRTLFTFNVRDFAVLHNDYLKNSVDHSGIIVSDQIEVGVLVKRLLKLIDQVNASDMINRIEFLSSWK